MARSFVDDALQSWEAWASSGRYTEHARIVFQSLTERGRRACIFPFPGTHAEAEHAVASADTTQLKAWLADARQLD